MAETTITSSSWRPLHSAWPDVYELAGNGQASHLGSVKHYQAILGNGDTLVETLVAANGDTLTILSQQVANPTSDGFDGSTTWIVIGGTGRFAGATGSGTGTTTIDLEAGTFTSRWIGQIRY